MTLENEIKKENEIYGEYMTVPYAIEHNPNIAIDLHKLKIASDERSLPYMTVRYRNSPRGSVYAFHLNVWAEVYNGITV